MLCRMIQLRFSLAWMCCVSTSRVYCHILKRFLPCAILPTGHLALEILPSNSEQGQHPVASQALSTRHWGLHSGAQEKGTVSFESSIFHLHDVKSKHEHGDTSTSEDDLLKLLNLPECTQTWTRFDKRAKTHRTTSSSGPLWENVVARITIRIIGRRTESVVGCKQVFSVLMDAVA